MRTNVCTISHWEAGLADHPWYLSPKAANEACDAHREATNAPGWWRVIGREALCIGTKWTHVSYLPIKDSIYGTRDAACLVLHDGTYTHWLSDAVTRELAG